MKHITCRTCKYVNSSSSKDPCHTCCITVNSDGNHISHSLWEPKDEEPDCEKCKHEDKGPEEEPCQECGIDGDNYFEPKDAEKLCKNCGVKSIEDQMMVCTHCYDHNKWRPKEEKKMEYFDANTKVNDNMCTAQSITIASVSQETLGILHDAYDELVSLGCFITGAKPNNQHDIRNAEPDCLVSNININREMAHEIRMQIAAIRRLFE